MEKKNKHDDIISGNQLDIKELNPEAKEVFNKYDPIFNYSLTGVVIHNPDSKILYCNNQAEQILGISYSEMIGVDAIDPRWKFVYEDGSDMKLEDYPVMKVLNNKEPFISYYVGIIHPKKRNNVSHVIVNGSPIIEDGKLRYIIINFIDQTNKIEERIKFKKREEQLLNIITHSSNMFYSHTTEHQLTYVSPQVKTIIGIEPEEAMVKWTTFITDNPVNEEGFKTTLKAIETGKAQPPYELELKKADGRIIWVEVREAPIIKDNKVTAIVGSLNDITKRKKAQQDLLERERFLDKIIESSALSTWISDDKGYAIRTNQACLDFFGAKEDEVVNKYCLFQDSVLIEKGFMPELRKVFNENKVVKLIVDYDFNEVDHVNVENGTHKVVNSIFTPVIDNKGKVTNVIVQSIDLTEIKETEKQLRLAKEKAEESDNLKSAFLANMSHEIRTPMNGILGFTELLKQHDLSPSSKLKYIDIIQKSGERMLSTINDIIEISKIETGQIKPRPETININEVLTDYYEFFNPEASAKGIKMTYSTTRENKHAVILADNMMLNSILTNLIKNAIKYTDKGTIEFGYKTKDQELEFYVSDTGIGISQKEQKAVFERFRQSEHPKSRVYEGSGLGLAITKAFIEMMKGSLWLESEKEVGSTFYFTLPFKSITRANSKKQTEKPADITPALKTMNILVVEDDPFGTLLLNEILEDQVGKIYSESSGAKALEVFNNNHIDIILMDIKIPDINGLSLTKQIRQTDNDVIIIAQTAYAMAGDREKALQAGCNDYLSKPINQKELLKILNRLINLKK